LISIVLAGLQMISCQLSKFEITIIVSIISYHKDITLGS